MSGRSLFDKVWDAHVVEAPDDGRPTVLYIDLHLIHEVTSPQAFQVLRERGLPVRRPDRTLGTLDHSTPTLPAAADGSRPYLDDATRAQVEALERNCVEFGIDLRGWDSPDRGIVHVIAPELGRTQPGMTIVCGDSHTSTHGAFGALAFGIGTTEVGHVLATQCLLQRKPKSLAVTVDGDLPAGVSAKDLTLHIAGVLGIGGATGHVIEFRGSAVRALSMEGRMTLCNMSIEMGARAGMVSPDATTVDYLRGRPEAPHGTDFERAAARWLSFAADPEARYDREVRIDARDVAPTVTWGTDPGKALSIDALVPPAQDAAARKALDYMRLAEGQAIAGTLVDVVFVGSCTNSRLSDLRAAAEVLRGRRIDPRVRMLVVPGSERVKREAEAEGLHEVFRAAGAEWREPGCSMCIGMNGDIARPGELVVSTSNRNFEGRQGKGVRTVLASPATAAASAVRGAIADPRALTAEGVAA
ncbi:MAG: 3-isopropylmalate dehydratase large subunit [Xanthomonadaceae bacterium]|nr:3-isopropylmalate dehydratase large subunit [Xanthomonadaceae bacterium]